MSNHETGEIERLAGAFAALSNPQRLRMFIKLVSTGCSSKDEPGRFCCATKVGDGLDLAGSTVSHHLKELRQAGLMHVERHGRQIDCWASREMLERLAAFFAELAPADRQVKKRKARVARGGSR